MDLAYSKGIDGFSLNIGRDDWQPDRVADAFAAATGTPFKLILSFDMASLPCSTLADGAELRQYVEQYHSHDNYLRVGERPLVTTFGGQYCQFGQPTVNEGWRRIMKTHLTEVHFVPSLFVEPSTYSGLSSTDGAFSWDSGWPMGNYDISNDSDVAYLSALNGKTYMAAVSPWFFTHYGVDSYNKNFIFRADNWLLVERWEMLVQERDHIDMVQVISWNDYGESHYMGPIEGAQPHSEAWTTGFDHQGWLDLQQYYIQGYKTGQYPGISRIRIFLWGRLHPALEDIPSDPVGKPENFRFTEDFVWAVIFLPDEARLNLSCGENVIILDLDSGVSKVRLPVTNDCTPTATIVRESDGYHMLVFTPQGYNWTTRPTAYNFNAFVAASP
ncbi:alpha-1,3-glucanase [Coprinopsis cinerea okayama7|uniref:Alpha-1,3-glucanase n=1 Tax=Coprinopsis cinerea (strain Okayama-7 / 130 / ATCC MYA-4618 / FGSC 9003) TaxID=240176 RepID=A8NN70_COPC7|nr:alpha-1,3-glucanase [Coprinopsis cinerea okayama7\|eukprot:XP_001835060.2 alpha-1,3-glucanase [Coprinopsis cinerea okayama7\